MCAAKWGHQGASKDLARLAEQRGGWLGQQNHDPGLDPDECHRCHGDGSYPGVRYCRCAAGVALMRSDFELASEAALTRFDDEERYCEIAVERMGQEAFDFGEAA